MKQRVDRQKPVIGIHKQTGEQVYFPSPYYAPGFKRAGIKEAISVRAKSHRGYLWRYANKHEREQFAQH